MLDPADILFDRQPFGDLVAFERFVIGLAGEAQEIPARIHECVERIGLAGRRAAAGRAGGVLPRRMAQQRVARSLEVDIFGQGDRQLFLRHRHHTTRIAMDKGDRRAPVPLARNAPVAQAPYRLAFAPALLLDPANDLALGGLDLHPVEEVGVYQHPVTGFCLAVERLARILDARGDDARDW